MQKKRTSVLIVPFSVLLLLALCGTGLAATAETYRFERLWPTLQQPWYFNAAEASAVDAQGNIYIADRGNARVVKLGPDGRFITAWGGPGEEDGKFSDSLASIATDESGSVYTCDRGNGRIQKFTADGRFVASWRKEDVALTDPMGVAVGRDGCLYVLDAGNSGDRIDASVALLSPEGEIVTKWNVAVTAEDRDRGLSSLAIDREGCVYLSAGSHVYVYTAEGSLIRSWGGEGNGFGEFARAGAIAFDSSGYVYVADSDGNRIEKFDREGKYVLRIWGSGGQRNGQFDRVNGISIGPRDIVTVTDYGNQRIQLFSSEGEFITKWGSSGRDSGYFRAPTGLALDRKGNLLVVDRDNGRIQVFSPEGLPLRQIQIDSPNGVAVDSSGCIYVSANGSITKYSPSWRRITSWGSGVHADGLFHSAWGMAFDSSQRLHVVEGDHIEVFASDGTFLKSWGEQGNWPGAFVEAIDIAFDSSGNSYVLDREGNRVEKFDPNGYILLDWGWEGTEDGAFEHPTSIKVDGKDNVYVVDRENNRIQVFQPDGTPLLSVGSRGTAPGQMSRPMGAALTRQGNLFVSDTENNRIQVFREVSVANRNKAIVVAGGGPYPGNRLWDATEMCANFAYRTLTYQGFTKEKIRYFSSDTQLDLDGNGLPDDITGDLSKKGSLERLKKAITEWSRNADNLVLYLTDHGGDGVFRLNDTEILTAQDVDAWLATLEGMISGEVIVILDACQSGSFLSRLSKPGRIIVTSTSPGEDAYFVNHGSVSFSNYFWTQIFNGLNLWDAFALASSAISYTTPYQNPLLEDGQNGALAKKTTLGNGTDTFNEAPSVAKISPPQTISGSTATLRAEGVCDPDGIARVWAIVRPPDFVPSSQGNPIQELPSFDLRLKGKECTPKDCCKENRYVGSFSGFDLAGTYEVALYAMDRIGNTSVPKLTRVSVQSPLSRKAILVAGGSQSDALWPSTEKTAGLAYRALLSQGYTDETITYLSAATTPGVDGKGSLKNLRDALETWAGSGTQDLVLYLVGSGDQETFRVNGKETLSAQDLSQWLDTVQETLPGKVTFVYDGCRSGSFLLPLAPPAGKERILISSTGADEPACFLCGGDISFSEFFWNEAANGSTVREAFLSTRNAIRYICSNQMPQLDDSGNGVGNEKGDGQLAERTTLGSGIVLAGDVPLIGSVSPPKTLHGDKNGLLWAGGVSGMNPIREVWAVITPPGPPPDPSMPIVQRPTLRLKKKTEGRYERLYTGFSTPGTYSIAVYAKDKKGAVSLPKMTSITQAKGRGR